MKPDGSGRAVGTKLARNAAHETVLGRGQPYRGEAEILGAPFFTAYDPIKDASGKVVGILYVGMKKSEFFAEVRTIETMTLVVGGGILAAILVLSLLGARMQFRPLGRLEQAMHRIAQGDTANAVPDADRGDEFGAMARALEVFRQNAIERERLAREQEEMSAKAEAERRAAIEDMAAALERSVRGVARSVQASADQRMEGMGQRIGDVVSLINGISGRTNLLALNATIEAARAGESGKGFAVVAHEVKQLAGQTAKATDDIATEINAVQRVATDAGRSIAEIASVVLELEKIAAEVASAIEEQAGATAEIGRCVEQAAAGSEQVGSGIRVIGEAAATTSSGAAQIRGAVDELGANSEALAKGLDEFLERVRAA
jgi:methyl-accepting chemotaxis protein